MCLLSSTGVRKGSYVAERSFQPTGSQVLAARKAAARVQERRSEKLRLAYIFARDHGDLGKFIARLDPLQRQLLKDMRTNSRTDGHEPERTLMTQEEFLAIQRKHDEATKAMSIERANRVPVRIVSGGAVSLKR